MENSARSLANVDKNILDLFWCLCNKQSNVRLKACSEILQAVALKQQKVVNENELCKDLEYCTERLVKGLASSRDAARLGYCLLLTEILKNITVVQIEEVLQLMKKHLIDTGNQDKRDLTFGQFFAYTSIVRSGRLPNHHYLSYVVVSLFELCHGKSYILNACYEIILDTFSQISAEKFKEKVWPPLHKKLPTDWNSSSADSLWLLLLCLRLFPNSVSKKYLKNHWSSDDLFSVENLDHLKRMMKQTSSSLPMLHPFCTEFLLHAKQRKDFNEIWTAVVDDNLYDADQKDKAFIGFEMVKLALKSAPTRKIVNTVLSSKFRVIFSKSFLSSKHPMHPAANNLAEFLCNFVKGSTVPEMQIMVLKVFLLLPGTVHLDHVLKKKEVSLIIQNLLPDAVKVFSRILIAVVLKKKPDSDDDDDDEEVNNMKRFQAVQQLGTLVAHPVILTDLEWRMDTIRFLFLHSFFTVKEITSDIPHCEKQCTPLPYALRDMCVNTFFKTLNSLHMRTENPQSSLSIFLQQLLTLTEYAELLMSATDNVEPLFSTEKIQGSWSHLKTIVQKLSKQSKKDGQENESSAFQALFLQIGFLLFQDTDHIPEVLEELYICCKKALKSRKNETELEDGEAEPPWIGVVIDILLSLLSKSSRHLRTLVTSVFPLFCPFIDQNALHQILDVINPQKVDEEMLVDDSDGEKADGVDFGSGSSSDDSDDEPDTQLVDDEFKKKIQKALGPAADDSDAESVVLSDSEMFKLDDALSHAFKSRVKSGHSQMASDEKTLLHFRVRCCDLILAFIKSEPTMKLALMCLEPIIAAFEFGHQGKHQSPLLQKTVHILQAMTRLRKFQHHQDVSKSELKRLLDMLIPKCHKEINMSTAQKLYNLCVFIVLCYRKLDTCDSPDKKKGSKVPAYIRIYLTNLDTFVCSGRSNMLPQFFTNLMEACPDLAWSFIEPCQNYAFSATVRLFKKTQCLGVLSEALKYAKGQKDIAAEQWLQFGSKVFPLVIESLKSALENSNIKPVYVTELLNIIFTTHSVVLEKTKQSLLENYADILPLLVSENSGKLKKLSSKGKSLKNKVITCLGGNVNENKKSLKKQKKRKSEEAERETENLVNGTALKQTIKKKMKKQKESVDVSVIDSSDGH